MDKLKQWVALTVVGCLAVLAAGWFLLISPKKSEAAGLKAQVASQTSANAMLVTKLATLKALAKDLPKQQAKLAAVAAKIPDNPALPALVRALDDAASEAGVELVSIAPSAPAPFTGAAGAVAPVAAGTAAGTATASGTAPAAVSSLQSIGVVVNVVGGYFQVEQFLDGLESLTRALKVTGFTLAPGANPVKPLAVGTVADAADTGRSLTASITGQVFLAPSTAPAVTTPVAAAATTTVK